MTGTRGPQNLLEGYARDVARGGAGRTMRENVAAMDLLVASGLVSDGNSVDGSTKTGGRAYDAVVAQFPHDPLHSWEIPAPLLDITASLDPYIRINADKGNSAIASPYDVDTGSTNLRNTFAGALAGAGISNKSNNTGFGYGVLSTPGTANQETAFGTGALQNDSGGLFNNAFGSNAGLQLTSGNANVLIGHGTVGGDDFAPVPMTGSQNSMVGNWAGQEFVTSTGNSALGEYAMVNITDGNNNVAIGVGALIGKGSFAPPSTVKNTATDNVAIGVFALRTTTSDLQVAVGWNSMFSDETGVENTALGVKTLALSVADFRNTAIGYWALANMNGGGSNTAVGAESLISATTPSGTTALGSQSGRFVTSGSNNTLIGFGVAPTLTTGVGNIVIGNSANADVAAAGTSHTLFIGGVGGTAAVAARSLDSATPIVTFPAMHLGASPIVVGGGQFGMPVTSLVGNAAPGAASVKIVAVAGTNAGTAKLVAFAGTSTTGVTILDNIGSGV